MTKSRSGGLARLPREQKCHFLIGPVSSWFMPNTTDLWTQSKDGLHDNDDTVISENHGEAMDCDNKIIAGGDHNRLSYFVYGSIGCFCYGEIYRCPRLNGKHQQQQQASSQSNHISAIVNQMVDIKDDNSRVSCVRFLKHSPFPLVLALTESGSLVIHDCFQNENLVHFKRNEVLAKFVGLSSGDVDATTTSGDQHSAKRAKFNVTQQINSCAWPRADTIFLGVSLLREKTCLLLRLKLNNIIDLRTKPEQIERDSIVLEHEKIDLDLQPYASPLCLLESAMLDEKVCIVAAGMDDGMITVVSINLDTNQKLRTIKLARHRDQICSLSLHLGNTNKFPNGLLASVSRDGLVLVWNIENENYFADYMTVTGGDNRGSGVRVNWFSLRFVTVKDLKSICLAVSNVDSGLTILEIPENSRSKIRLMENRDTKLNKRQQGQNDQTIKHNALIFNIEYDPITETLITSSLDGNHILWSLQRHTAGTNQSNRVAPLEVRPRFLSPAMLNNARTHMMRHNPIKEDLLCMALGKAGIKFHTISENLIDSRFDMTQSCAFVARKIAKANASPLSIAWHPNHEYRLAIGTLDGKVYRADITPRKAALAESELKQVTETSRSDGAKRVGSTLDSVLDVDYQPISRESDSNPDDNSQRQSKTDGVYSLCWGPNPASPQDVSKHAIYAVGSVSHRLFIYYNKNIHKDNCDKLANYLDEFHDKSLPEAQDRASEVAWKPSMALMALGTTDGRIIVATYLDESHQERSNNRLFKILAIVSGPLGDAHIQCLVWHPTSDSDDANYYKIVASSNESPAYVFNLKETILVADVKERLKLEQFNGGPNDNTCTTTATNMLSAYVNKLEGHQKAISDISWNPHEPNQLATCSFDRTCYVWSLDGCLMDAQIISKFSARDRLFTLEWSLVDTNLIYTSGNDSIIWAWRPTENRVKSN